MAHIRNFRPTGDLVDLEYLEFEGNGIIRFPVVGGLNEDREVVHAGIRIVMLWSEFRNRDEDVDEPGVVGGDADGIVRNTLERAPCKNGTIQGSLVK